MTGQWNASTILPLPDRTTLLRGHCRQRRELVTPSIASTQPKTSALLYLSLCLFLVDFMLSNERWAVSSHRQGLNLAVNKKSCPIGTRMPLQSSTRNPTVPMKLRNKSLFVGIFQSVTLSPLCGSIQMQFLLITCLSTFDSVAKNRTLFRLGNKQSFHSMLNVILTHFMCSSTKSENVMMSLR